MGWNVRRYGRHIQGSLLFQAGTGFRARGGAGATTPFIYMAFYADALRSILIVSDRQFRRQPVLVHEGLYIGIGYPDIRQGDDIYVLPDTGDMLAPEGPCLV